MTSKTSFAVGYLFVSGVRYHKREENNMHTVTRIAAPPLLELA